MFPYLSRACMFMMLRVVGVIAGIMGWTGSLVQEMPAVAFGQSGGGGQF